MFIQQSTFWRPELYLTEPYFAGKVSCQINKTLYFSQMEKNMNELIAIVIVKETEKTENTFSFIVYAMNYKMTIF